MNVVIYARYSSYSQGEASIEGQLKECHEYCKRRDYTVVEEYIDRALTGRSDKRPRFLQMIHDSKKRHFDAVIVYKLNRFARDRDDSRFYKYKLKKNGVKVISIHEELSDDPTSILIEGLLESLDEFYSADLAQNVTRGMRISAEKCLAMGTTPLGYMVDKERKYQIDPKTAPIIQYIYQSYANGMKIVEIIDYLNSQGCTTTKGTPFNKNSLRTILRSRRYIGEYSYMGIATPNGMPRIVSDELFYQVQDIMEKNRKAPSRAKAKVEYLLTTKLFCGHCKEMMTGHSANGKKGVRYNYYICNGRKQKNCEKELVKKEYIEELVIMECRKLLTDTNIAKIAREVATIFKKDYDNSVLKMLEKQLAENERKKRNLVVAVSECEDKSIRYNFYSQISKLEEEHQNIEELIIKEKKAQPTVLSESHIKFFLNAIKKGDINDMKYRKTLVKIFVNAIYLYDDRLTIVFNSGDETVTINDKLLSEIDKSSMAEKILFLDKSSPS